MLYLDHNATTNVHFEVIRFLQDLIKGVHNPSSIHAPGRNARKILETAREQVAKSVAIDLNSGEYQIIFTSSGTESNNLLINNYDDGEIFISAIEHLSIFEHIKYRNNIKIIEVDHDGIVDSDNLVKLLTASNSSKKLISVMLANNESGVIQDIASLVKIAKKYGAQFHSDIVQAVGKVPINIKELGIDFATISAHKLGGMQGSSALIARQGANLKAMIIGGGQERRIRSGTENLLSIASLGMATSMIEAELADRCYKMKRLQKYLEQALAKYKNVEIISKNAKRLPNTTQFIVPGTDGQAKLIAFDLRDIAVSSGSACSSGKVGKSHVLSAMGYSVADAKSSIRVSFNYTQTCEEVAIFIKAFEEIYAQELII
jgi:cysteine desulfurase